MTEQEYRSLQADLTEKMEKNPYRRNSATQRLKEGYEEGILAAKSVLSRHQKLYCEPYGVEKSK